MNRILCIALMLLVGASAFAAEPAKPAASKPAPAKPSGPPLTVNAQRAMGDTKAPLVVVEFTEYECPECKQYHLQGLPDIKRVYIDRKVVRYYHKNFSVDEAHSAAIQGGVVAYCAGRQGNFWKMQQRLFEEQHRLSQSTYVELAQELKLKLSTLEDCRWDPATTKAIATDRSEAAAHGIDVVPSFIVGRNTPGGIVVETLVKGEATFQAVAAAIEEVRQR